MARTVEVYDLGPPTPDVVAYPAQDVQVVTGGSEALVPLAAADLLPEDRATVLAGDAGGQTAPRGLSPGSVVVTDTLRARQRSFGGARTADVGPVQTAEQAAAAGTRDYLPWPDPGLRTVASYPGLRDLRSSPLAGPPGSVLAETPANRLYSALDTDPATAWVGLVRPDRTIWMELELERPQPVDGLTLELLTDSVTWAAGLARPTSIAVTTDSGTVTTSVDPQDDEVRLDTPSGVTSTLRVELRGLDGDVAGITTLVVPGLSVSENLVVPDLPSAVDHLRATYVLTQDGSPSDGCLLQAEVLRCRAADVSPPTATDLVRTLPAPDGGDWSFAGTLRAQPGPDLDRLLDVGGLGGGLGEQPPQPRGSSTSGRGRRRRPAHRLEPRPLGPTTWAHPHAARRPSGSSASRWWLATAGSRTPT